MIFYNFTETGLFYRWCPSSTLASKPVTGNKHSKARITGGFLDNLDVGSDAASSCDTCQLPLLFSGCCFERLHRRTRLRRLSIDETAKVVNLRFLLVCQVEQLRLSVDSTDAEERRLHIAENQCERTKALSTKRRSLWLARIKRANLDIENRNLRVCGAHFIAAKLFDETDPDWAPSLLLGYGAMDTDPSRHQRLEKRRAEKREAELQERRAEADAAATGIQPCADRPLSPHPTGETDADESEKRQNQRHRGGCFKTMYNQLRDLESGKKKKLRLRPFGTCVHSQAQCVVMDVLAQLNFCTVHAQIQSTVRSSPRKRAVQF
ncbi:hypothetical protein HPB49_019690 [Dermacentor silvarum]|uniref:Uncharacterized protein n=1 Tax=Dermacentor silvarum TaxID=543639 RepID=A0ACB8D7T3_DERSI|nr:hypothetical protein HPB49_019690 [Dermacentor silvarum]